MGINITRSFRQQVMDLEDRICDAQSFAAILLGRLHMHFERNHEKVTGNKDFYYLSEEDIDCLLFAGGQLKRNVGKVKSNFYKALDGKQLDLEDAA